MPGTMSMHSFSLYFLFHLTTSRIHRGYTYSLVLASVRYATVFKKVLLDLELGWELYRDKVLLAGGNRDGVDSFKVCQISPEYRERSDRPWFVVDLLGREPNPKAFIMHLILARTWTRAYSRH